MLFLKLLLYFSKLGLLHYTIFEARISLVVTPCLTRGPVNPTRQANRMLVPQPWTPHQVRDDENKSALTKQRNCPPKFSSGSTGRRFGGLPLAGSFFYFHQISALYRKVLVLLKTYRFFHYPTNHDDHQSHGNGCDIMI